jgi:hypothetical protein
MNELPGHRRPHAALLRTTPRSSARTSVCTRVLWMCLFVCAPVGLGIQAQTTHDPITAVEMRGLMGRGINLGNTLEPPTEGAWNNPRAETYYFADYKASGFQTVRIPIRYDGYTGQAAPYTITPTYLSRIQTLVDAALAQGLIVIINSHHDDWIKTRYAEATQRDRFDAIWRQVATRFSAYPPELVFEIINEPNGLTLAQVNDLNARVYQIMRETNPTRNIIFSGHNYSGASELIQAALPAEGDPYLMGYFHSYNPWNFAGLANGTWGSAADRAAIDAEFKQVRAWSDQHQIPVMISEFGAIHPADHNSRMRHYYHYVQMALKYQFPFQAWDDGGDFGIYQRASRTWRDERDLLIETYADGPADFRISGDTTFTLSWADQFPFRLQDITIERRVVGDAYDTLAVLPLGTVSYVDQTAQGGISYDYRIRYRADQHPDRVSYPIRVTRKPTARRPFQGNVHQLPGTIEAEHYDEGGQGLTFFDSDAQNTGGAFRPAEGVDIQARDDGGFHVGWVTTGEWLEYTVSTTSPETLFVTAEVASALSGGSFRYLVDGTPTRSISVPSTGSWQTTTTVGREVVFPGGSAVLRLEILRPTAFNIDRLVATRPSSTARAIPGEVLDGEFDLYPNPATHTLWVRSGRELPGGQIALFDTLGRRVAEAQPLSGLLVAVPVDHLTSGLYLAEVRSAGQTAIHPVMIVR